MTCPRHGCGGLLVYEVDEIPMLRCLACGNRIMEPFVPYEVPERKWAKGKCRECGSLIWRKSDLCRGCTRIETSGVQG